MWMQAFGTLYITPKVRGRDLHQDSSSHHSISQHHTEGSQQLWVCFGFFYPETVFMAADVEMLYYDLRAVSDLTAAVTANRFTGPAEEEKSEFLCNTSWFQSQHWYQRLLS